MRSPAPYRHVPPGTDARNLCVQFNPLMIITTPRVAAAVAEPNGRAEVRP